MYLFRFVNVAKIHPNSKPWFSNKKTLVFRRTKDLLRFRLPEIDKTLCLTRCRVQFSFLYFQMNVTRIHKHNGVFFLLFPAYLHFFFTVCFLAGSPIVTLGPKIYLFCVFACLFIQLRFSYERRAYFFALVRNGNNHYVGYDNLVLWKMGNVSAICFCVSEMTTGMLHAEWKKAQIQCEKGWSVEHNRKWNLMGHLSKWC